MVVSDFKIPLIRFHCFAWIHKFNDERMSERTKETKKKNNSKAKKKTLRQTEWRNTIVINMNCSRCSTLCRRFVFKRHLCLFVAPRKYHFFVIICFATINTREECNYQLNDKNRHRIVWLIGKYLQLKRSSIKKMNAKFSPPFRLNDQMCDRDRVYASSASHSASNGTRRLLCRRMRRRKGKRQRISWRVGCGILSAHVAVNELPLSFYSRLADVPQRAISQISIDQNGFRFDEVENVVDRMQNERIFFCFVRSTQEEISEEFVDEAKKKKSIWNSITFNRRFKCVVGRIELNWIENSQSRGIKQ